MGEFEQPNSDEGRRTGGKNFGGGNTPEIPEEIPEEIMKQLRENPELRRKFTSAIGEIEGEARREEYKRKEKVRLQELSVWLGNFKIEGLALGKTEVTVKGPGEQYGVYHKGKHLGDIWSGYSNALNFDRADFQAQVAAILSSAGIERKSGGLDELLVGSRVTISVDEKVLRRLVESGVSVSGDRWRFKNETLDLYNRGENAVITVTETEEGSGKFVMEITENKGRVIRYDIIDGKFQMKSRREL